jgi:hypothetical protein
MSTNTRAEYGRLSVQAIVDRRKDPRSLTLKTGTIRVPGGMSTVACAILDISDGGARILVPIDAEVPATFALAADRSDLNVLCKLEWRFGTRIGVSFHHGQDIGDGEILSQRSEQ